MSSQFRPEAALRAAVMITGSSYFTYGVGMIASAIVARQVGPDDFGRYAYLVWLAGLFVLIATSGLTTTGIRFVSDLLGRNQASEADAVHRWLLVRQYLTILGVTLSIFACGQWLTPQGWTYDPRLFLILAIFAGATKAMYLFQISIAKGHGRYEVEAYSVVLLSLVNLVGTVALFALGAQLLSFIVFFVVLSVGYLLVSALMLGRFQMRASGVPVAATLSRVRPHLFWSVVLALVVAFSNKTVETWMLNHYATAAQVGFFVIAATLTRGGVDVVSSGLNTVLMPMMSHGYGAEGQQRVESLLSDAMRYFQFLGVLVAGVGWFWAEPIIHLMYGVAYQPAVLAFKVMVLVAGLTLTEGAIGALLSTTENQRLRASFAGISLVTSLSAAWFLIPPYGLAGAVAAHALSQLVLLIASIGIAMRLSQAGLPWLALSKVVICGALAGLVGYAVVSMWAGDLSAFVAGLVFATLYLLIIRWSGFWLVKDARVVGSMLTRVPRRIKWFSDSVRWYFPAA